MAIRSFVMEGDGTLTIDVDTLIQPGVLGVTSPTLTIVQAIDFIGYDKDIPSALSKIKEYDLTSQTLADFGIVNKVNVQAVSPLPDAQTKYSGVTAGSKLFSTKYPLSIDGDIRNEIIAANTKTGYCVRIRTVMMDESVPSSPRLPNTIAEFNQAVLSLGTPDSIKDFHHQYYSCISIPVNVVAGQFLFVDPLVYYDWGSKTDTGIAVTGTSKRSVVAPIQLKLSWYGYEPAVDVTQSGDKWIAVINDPQDSYIYVGPGAENDIWESQVGVTYKDADGNNAVTVKANSVGRLPIASRVISSLKPTAIPEHLVTSSVFNTWDQLPPVIIDRDTGMISLETILKINREDEVALNGNDLRVWIYAYVTPYVEGSTYRDDSYNLPPTLLSSTLIVHDVSDFWSVPGKRVNYSNVFIGSNNTWQVFKFDLPMPTLMSGIESMRGSGSTDTKYVVAVFTIVGRDNHNPPVPWPTSRTEYEMHFYNNVNYDYRNVTYLSLEVPMPVVPEPEPIPEETFTVDKPYYYEYGSTANPTVVISGTASGPISVADLSISVLDGNYVDKPLTIHSVDKVGDKWTAVVSDPNVKKVIPGPMHKAYSATDYTTNLFTKLETTFRYTNPTSGKVWEIYTDDINVHCPTQTRAVNLDSPRTTHEVINSFRGGYPSEVGHSSWWSDLPYARLDLDTGVLSVDVIVKLVKPEEIALNGNGLKLWVRTQMDLDTNLTSLVSFDAKKLVTDNALTLNKSLAVIDNLGDIWNDPTKVQPYIDKFPDAPVEAKDWKIVKVDIPLGKNFKADTNAARTALGFASLPTTDLLLTIHTFIGRPDMSRTPPYPDSIEAFNKAFIDSLTKYPYNLSGDNSLVMRSHLKIDLPV